MTNDGENVRLDPRWIDDQKGLVSREIFGSPAVHELEKDRIFRKSWLYLGHETEIPNSGDVVTRTMAGDPVIVVRREDGTIGAYLNSCAHRGVKVCRVDKGNTRRFVCPYHGWSYGTDGALISTNFDALYPEGTDFSTMGLIPVTRLDSYKGMIFGNWSEEGESLDEYLGDFRWYLDLFFARTPGGAQVLGPPQRFVVNADWKTAAINFGTDNTHVITTHIGPMTLSPTPFSPPELMAALGDAVQVSTGNGHSVSLVSLPGERYAHYPKELHDLYDAALEPEQADVLASLAIGVSTVFPNLSFIENTPTEVEPGVYMKGLLLRQWHPIAPGQIEVLSWQFAEVEASADYKRAVHVRAVNDFGVGGIFEQEDVELWSSVGSTTTTPAAREHPFVFSTAVPFLDHPVPGHAGPGSAYQPFVAEITQFKFLQHWNKLMTESVS
ncbi:aromatic ring-hydroxylating oxygenase subunit alpha [Nocardia sienata]|uniref:aromatic ring-hydroxylating oxygenase subunit alpha n=1 Tax=Nocardia sienata TaxID=248552 RepID=UPI000ACAAD6C|nr:Rieske 2Fe-2S domain-containing protein [Nocardia sienata]